MTTSSLLIPLPASIFNNEPTSLTSSTSYTLTSLLINHIKLFPMLKNLFSENYIRFVDSSISRKKLFLI